jgi:hypothetical protein
MKVAGILSVMVVTALVTQPIGVSAGAPDPPFCPIEPWNTYGHAFVTPGSNSEGGVGEVSIQVFNINGDPIPGAFVEIRVSDCMFDVDMCLNPGGAGLTGTTNDQGIVVLNPQIGACGECETFPIVVLASGVTIGSYPRIVSTDWDGVEADGFVGVADFAFFSTAFKVTGDECADYNGDGVVNGADFAIFSTSFKRGDANTGGCE